MTSIQWTDKVWNPLIGCSRVSAGCEHCYAERVAHRGMTAEHRGLTVLGRKGPRWTGEVRFLPERLSEPLRWRKARMVFVNSISDLFHEGVSNEQIAAVFGVMAAAPEHTFQVLTKRPERMRDWFARMDTQHGTEGTYVEDCIGAAEEATDDGLARMKWLVQGDWPLPNVWLGVSIEDQSTADERIPLLLDTPAALRWVSYEPALGPVDFAKWLEPWTCSACEFHGSRSDSGRVRCGDCDEDAVYAPEIGSERCPKCGKDDGASSWVGDTCPECGSVESWSQDAGFMFPVDSGIDWIVIGGESGPGARPFELAWARSTIEQCAGAGVPVFVKQLGVIPVDTRTIDGRNVPPGVNLRAVRGMRDRKGGDMSEWPEDLRIRQFPEARRAA